MPERRPEESRGSRLSALGGFGRCWLPLGQIKFPGLNSAQLKASSTLDGIKQFASQQGFIIKFWELQQIHAGAGCR